MMVEKNAGKVWPTMAWATYDGDVLLMKALRSILGWRTTLGGRTRGDDDALTQEG